MNSSKVNFLNFFVFVLSAVIITTSCNREKEIIINVDNPTNKDLVFKIDSIAYKVYPLQLAQFKVMSGDHNFIVGKDTFKVNFDKRKKYMINPSQSTYIIDEIIFADEDRQNYDIQLPDSIMDQIEGKLEGTENYKSTKKVKDTIMIEIEALGGLLFPFDEFSSKTDKFVIEKTWDYGVKQPAPKYIEVRVTKNEEIFGTSRSRIKIYRRADFVKYILDEAAL